MCCFLVPVVPLVFQQASVLQANCSFRVCALCGDFGIDFWSKKDWDQLIESYDILVMTPEILVVALRHRRVFLSDFALLIFDECHHANQNNPYALIMSEHYERAEPIDRPQIFGMTASPFIKHDDVRQSLQRLMTTLDSQIVSVQNEKDEASFYASVSQSRELFYDIPPKYRATPLFVIMYRKFGQLKCVCNTLDVARRILGEHGPWCADDIWRVTFSPAKMSTSLKRKLVVKTPC